MNSLNETELASLQSELQALRLEEMKRGTENVSSGSHIIKAKPSRRLILPDKADQSHEQVSSVRDSNWKGKQPIRGPAYTSHSKNAIGASGATPHLADRRHTPSSADASSGTAVGFQPHDASGRKRPTSTPPNATIASNIHENPSSGNHHVDTLSVKTLVAQLSDAVEVGEWTRAWSATQSIQNNLWRGIVHQNIELAGKVLEEQNDLLEQDAKTEASTVDWL